MDNERQPTLSKQIRSAVRHRCLKPLWLSLRNARIRLRPDAVFIFGNQKTGSTAIAALLGQACGLKVTQDLFYHMPEPMEHELQSGKRDFKSVIRAYKPMFAADIIKEPALTFYFPALLECWPKGRFVFLIRDPRDNIRSLLNRLELSGNLPDLSPTDHEALPSDQWRLILDGTPLGTRGANYIETLANRWKRAVNIYRDHRNRILLLRYEDFLADKTGTIHKLAGQLGLEVRHDIRDAVNVQYQSKGDRSVSWIDFFGRDNLGRIERICAEGMKELGYDPSIER